MHCNICNNRLTAPVYQTTNNKSLSSLCELIDADTQVFFCENCLHCYTPPVDNISEYYSNDYKILIESDEEDQYVFFADGRKIFRFDLQLENLSARIDLTKDIKLLDYGCAKSMTIKKLCDNNQQVKPHLYDVSDMYIPFWKKFIPEENWATFQAKPEWKNYFDVITSFFSLEHVAEPDKVLQEINQLLKPGGKFYCVVPNMYVNSADFIVADHVNHFSSASLTYTLEKNGFTAIEIDPECHYGAYTLVATKHSGDVAKEPGEIPDEEREQLRQSNRAIADFWSRISDNILNSESTCPVEQEIAIYGSGFYGALIASHLRNLDRVSCFIDQNPYRQKQKLFGKPIVSPDDLPEQIAHVFIGLNPEIAKESIAGIRQWAGRDLTHHYL